MAFEIVEFYDEPDVKPEKTIPELLLSKVSQVPGEVARHGARGASRIAETIGSIPRAGFDIAQAIGGLAPESLTSEEEHPAFAQASRDISKLGEYLPTAQDIRKRIGAIAPEGYLEPKNEGEKFVDDVISDFTSLAVPIGPLGGVSKLTAAAASTLGNLGSLAAKKIGYGETGQNVTKLGLMFATSLGKGLNLKKKSTDWYNMAERVVKPNEAMSARYIEPAINKLEKEYLFRGFRGKEKKIAAEAIEDLRATIRYDGKIGLSDLAQFKKELPKKIFEVGGADSPPGQYLVQLSKDMGDAIKKHSPNKKFSEAMTAADQLFSGSKAADKINNFALKAMGNNKALQAGAGYAFLSNPIKTMKNSAKAFGLGSIYGATAHAFNGAKNMLSNPAVTREYIGIMNAAAKENTPLVIKHAKKFNIQFEKSLRKMLEDESGKPQRGFEILSLHD